jgi:hypothetical protein
MTKPTPEKKMVGKSWYKMLNEDEYKLKFAYVSPSVKSRNDFIYDEITTSAMTASSLMLCRFCCIGATLSLPSRTRTVRLPK